MCFHKNIRKFFQFTKFRKKDNFFSFSLQNLTQYFSEEQKKMMDLWTELQQVRRQFTKHREQTEHDLENQRNEFTRLIRNVGGITRQLNFIGVEVSNSRKN